MILVTGATGLLGSHLLTALVAQDKPVKALYRSAIPHFEGADKAIWIQGDILDISLLQEAMQGVQQVYHCAAVVSFNPKRKAELFQTNIEGTANVVNACVTAGVQKIVHVSSVAALGRLNRDTSINENMQWTPKNNNSQYGKSKYLAEMEVWRGIGEGLQAVIVNPSIILGTGDWNTGSTEIFKTAYDEFPWFTNGITGFVDVLDVVQAMILLMNSSITDEQFIINSENIAYKIIFSMIAACFGKKGPHKRVTPFMAGTLWRLEAVKHFFTGVSPLLTKETAASAQAKVSFENQKLLSYIPEFQFHSLSESIFRICKELTVKYKLM